jgi:hypothetical protein
VTGTKLENAAFKELTISSLLFFFGELALPPVCSLGISNNPANTYVQFELISWGTDENR